MTDAPAADKAPVVRPEGGGRFFAPSDFVLTVGDGDFGFSMQLARIIGGSNIMATTLLSQEQTFRTFPQAFANMVGLNQLGAIVNFCVDATERKPQWDVQFDRIVFNFPETVEFAGDDLSDAVPANQYLLAAFFFEFARMLMPKGRIYVTIKRGFPFDSWDLPLQASCSPYLRIIEIVSIPHDQYPVYEPRLTSSNDTFAINGAELYVFELKDEFSAAAQSNILRHDPHPPPTREAFGSLRPQEPVVVCDVRPTPVVSEEVKTFTFTRLHDRMGIMYYLGMKAGGRRSWRNPVDAGLVCVRASGMKRGSRNGAEVGDHTFTSQVFYTDNIPGSAITIDLGAHLVSPNFYVMAHRGGLADFFARTWVFQGSPDGVAWRTLRNHQNDGSLNPQCYSAGWALPMSGEYFRQFRVVLAPGGNSRGSHALVLSCFELYGRLREDL